MTTHKVTLTSNMLKMKLIFTRTTFPNVAKFQYYRHNDFLQSISLRERVSLVAEISIKVLEYQRTFFKFNIARKYPRNI